MLKITFGCPGKAFYKLIFFSFYWIYCMLKNNFILAPGVPRHNCWLIKGTVFDSCWQPALCQPLSFIRWHSVSLDIHRVAARKAHILQMETLSLKEAQTVGHGRITWRNQVSASCPWPRHGVGGVPSAFCSSFSRVGGALGKPGLCRSLPKSARLPN